MLAAAKVVRLMNLSLLATFSQISVSYTFVEEGDSRSDSDEEEAGKSGEIAFYLQPFLTLTFPFLL